MKKASKSEIFIAIISIFSAFAMILIKTKLSKLCTETNSPFLIFLDLQLNGYVLVILFFAFFFLICCISSLKTLLSDLKVFKDSFISWKSILILAVLLFIPNFSVMTKEFGDIKVNGKKPLKMQYSYYLLCDAVKGETETLVLNSEEFHLHYHSYTTGGGRGHVSRPITVCYASYEGFNSYLYNTALKDYIKLCQNSQKDIELEYYKNSGIIKTIDGINLYDSSGFSSAVYNVEQKQREILAEETALKKEQERKELALFSAFFQSEGDNYEEIVRKLEKEGIENTYDVIYISTEYFEIGSVALFDNTQNVIYVVRDNKKEDMIEIPSLPHNGTFTEVTKILDENGIKWTFDCFGNHGQKQDESDHSHDILKTIHSSPGTPIPKDYVFWFSVDHVG